MHRSRIAASLSALLVLPGTALASDASPAVRDLICEAQRAGNAAVRDEIARLAQRSDPGAADAIARFTADVAQGTGCYRPVMLPLVPLAIVPPPPILASAQVARPAPREPMKKDGQVEFGLGQVTGNTSSASVSLAGNAKLSGKRWQHQLRANLDYQRTDGTTALERYAGAYDFRRKLDDAGTFLAGRVSAERDMIAGYDYRMTESVALGTRLRLAKGLRVDVSGGPSLRQTNRVDTKGEFVVGGRGSMQLDWEVSPGFRLASSASAIVEADNSTLESETSLTGKISGPLSTRLAFTARREESPLTFGDPLTTISRAAIVYAF